MTHSQPGLNPRRLVKLMHEAVDRCELNLSGTTVLTEAASGAYLVTPVLAALAGAQKVFALTKTTRYGTVEEIAAQTNALAELAGVASRVQVVTEKTRELVAQADIITNSGHVRPIESETISWMKPTAVVPLMYESWEVRDADIDLDACRRKGIKFAGTNERHPKVDVFSFLGIMAVKLLLDAGVSVYGSKLIVLCDNPFAPFIEKGLRSGGAGLEVCKTWREIQGDDATDAILVALQPQSTPVLGATEAAAIAKRWPGAVVAQYWGDVDRTALSAHGIPTWPLHAPPAGHMGILPSEVGPEPIVRLQAGGLKVAELLRRGPSSKTDELGGILDGI